MSDHLPDRFTDEHARAILARAIEIDSRSPMTSIDDLRAIAAEIGVSPGALEAALQQQRDTITSGRIAAARRGARITTALGLPLGITAGTLLSSGAVLPVLGVMAAGLAASGALVVFQASSGSLRSFHLRNLMLWGGVCAGSVATATLLGSGSGLVPAVIAAGWCLRSWVASSILGSAGVLAVRRARPTDPSDADPDISTATALTRRSRWADAAKRLLTAITRPFQKHRWRAPFALSRYVSLPERNVTASRAAGHSA